VGLLRKLTGQTAVYGLSSIVGRLVNWGLTPFYLHYFDRAEYGIQSDLYAFSFYPVILLTFGMETAFFHYTAKSTRSDSVYHTAFSTILAFCAVFLLIFAVPYPFWADVLGYGQRPVLILILAGIIVADAAAALPLARLRYQEKALKFALISGVNVVLTVVFSVWFVAGVGMGVEGVFLANLLASLVRLAMALEGNAPDFRQIRVGVRRQLVVYGFYIMAAGLLGACNEMLGRNLIPRLWPSGQFYDGEALTGLEMNGIYSANYKLAMLVALVTQAFRYAMEPYFFRSAEEKESPRNFARIFHYYTLACLAASLWVAVFARHIASFNFFGAVNFTLLPAKYWNGLSAVPAVLLANTLFGAYLNLGIWYKLTAQLRFGIFFAAVGAGVTLLGNAWLIPHWGYRGSAWASVACYAVMCGLCYHYGQKFRPIPYNIKRIFLYFVVFVVFWRMAMAVSSAFVQFAICVWCLATIYVWEKKSPPRFEPKRR
jgi:O-antigen/teichoic acid export membrane protein